LVQDKSNEDSPVMQNIWGEGASSSPPKEERIKVRRGFWFLCALCAFAVNTGFGFFRSV
jgi:hypothetical protein